MKKIYQKVLSGVLGLVILSSLVACGGNQSGDSSGEKNKTPDHSEKLTIDFINTGNYQGLQPGAFAKVVKDKFNLELNIISTTLSGGDSFYQTRFAAGDLGDAVELTSAQAKECVSTDLIMDLTDYYNNSKYLKDFELAINGVKQRLDTDKVYAFPTGCMNQSAVTPVFEFHSPYNGSFLRLDYYNAIGAPKIKNMDDLLNVLKQMQEKFPKTESGKKTYAFSLFKDWDGVYMNLAAQMSWMYGYDNGTVGFMFTNADASEVQDVAQDDGVYYKALQLYFKANQMGLVDPDSSTQNWDNVWSKAVEGQNLFSWWSFLASGFNTDTNKQAGKYMAYVPIEGQKLLSKGATTYGENKLYAIGKNAKQPERVFEFIDWLASEEAPYYSAQANAGPKGCTWDIDENGRPYLTEDGLKANADSNYTLPEEFGGGTLTDGESKIGPIRSAFSINSETKETFVSQTWQTYLEKNFSKADELYKEIFATNHAEEYVVKNDLLTVAPSTTFAPPLEDSEIGNKRAQCGDIIKQISWKMVFAKDEAEFNSLWDDMKKQLKGFGYEDVLKVDQTNVASLREARLQAIEDSK